MDFERVFYAFSQDVRRQIKKEQKHRCAMTGVKETKAEPLQVHHRIPTAMNGSDHRLNGVALTPAAHKLADAMAFNGGLIYNPDTKAFDNISEVPKLLFK